jgi:hypothetical protein
VNDTIEPNGAIVANDPCLAEMVRSRRAYNAGKAAAEFFPFDPRFYLEHVVTAGGDIPAIYGGRLFFRCAPYSHESQFLNGWLHHAPGALDMIRAVLRADPALNAAMNRLGEIENEIPTELDRMKRTDEAA